jgi:hypothetical protein
MTITKNIISNICYTTWNSYRGQRVAIL